MNRLINALTSENFITSLKVMVKGMLAIFIVMACILIAVYLFNLIFSGKNKK